MDWFLALDIKLQAGLISAITSIFIFISGWILKPLYESWMLNQRLKKEFKFEQKKKLKTEIALTKVHLLNATEELNHRLWNFSQNIDENWHKVDSKDWLNPKKYYINSFVYRFLIYIYWLIEAERKTLSIDTTVADPEDILYLKYIKTLKDIITDIDMFEGLEYDMANNTHHFYKNDLVGYTRYILNDNKEPLDFDQFLTQNKNKVNDLEKVFQYFSLIKNTKEDKVLNILKCSHLIAISFLNQYGHDYQKTPKEKMDDITLKYEYEISVYNNFEKFINKSKLKKEIQPLLKKIKN